MVSRAMKFLSTLFSTNRPSSLRDRVLDFLGGAVGRVPFRYQPGQEMRDKVFDGPGDLHRRYRIVEQKIYARQPYYTLIDSATDAGPLVFLLAQAVNADREVGEAAIHDAADTPVGQVEAEVGAGVDL